MAAVVTTGVCHNDTLRAQSQWHSVHKSLRNEDWVLGKWEFRGSLAYHGYKVQQACAITAGFAAQP